MSLGCKGSLLASIPNTRGTIVGLICHIGKDANLCAGGIAAALWSGGAVGAGPTNSTRVVASHGIVQQQAGSLAHGSTAILLQLYKERSQGSGQLTTYSLPCKRSAADMKAAAQPVSKSEQRRRKQSVRWEQTQHKRRMLEQQQQLSEQQEALRSDTSTTSGPGPSSTVPAGMLQSIEASGGSRRPPGAANPQRSISKQEIPGENGISFWQRWLGAYKVLAGQMNSCNIGLVTLPGTCLHQCVFARACHLVYMSTCRHS